MGNQTVDEMFELLNDTMDYLTNVYNIIDKGFDDVSYWSKRDTLTKLSVAMDILDSLVNEWSDVEDEEP